MPLVLFPAVESAATQLPQICEWPHGSRRHRWRPPGAGSSSSRHTTHSLTGASFRTRTRSAVGSGSPAAAEGSGAAPWLRRIGGRCTGTRGGAATLAALTGRGSGGGATFDLALTAGPAAISLATMPGLVRGRRAAAGAAAGACTAAAATPPGSASSSSSETLPTARPTGGFARRAALPERAAAGAGAAAAAITAPS